MPTTHDSWTLPADDELDATLGLFAELLSELDNFRSRMSVDLSGFVGLATWLEMSEEEQEAHRLSVDPNALARIAVWAADVCDSADQVRRDAEKIGRDARRLYWDERERRRAD